MAVRTVYLCSEGNEIIESRGGWAHVGLLAATECDCPTHVGLLVATECECPTPTVPFIGSGPAGDTSGLAEVMAEAITRLDTVAESNVAQIGEAIRKRWPEIPFIWSVRLAVDLDAEGFVRKPF